MAKQKCGSGFRPTLRSIKIRTGPGNMGTGASTAYKDSLDPTVRSCPRDTLLTYLGIP